jgi:DNA invertase Pin-like site-specific DNA recombinase
MMGRKQLTLTVSSGETHTLAEWSAKTGISREAIRLRLKSGRTPDEAVGIVQIPRKWSEKTTIDVSGVVKSVEEWSKESGILESTIRRRMKGGWSPAQCVGLEAPPSLIEWEGQYYTISELCRMYGKTHQTVSYRMKKGLSLKDALTRPKNKIRGGRPKWKPDAGIDADVKRDWLENSGLSQNDIATKYGVSPVTLRKHLGKRGIKKELLDAQTKADAKLDWLEKPELSEYDIAAKYGTTPDTLRRYLGKRPMRKSAAKSKPKTEPTRIAPKARPSYTVPEIKKRQARWTTDAKLEAEARRDWLENRDLATSEIEEKYDVSRQTLIRHFGERPFYSPHPSRWKADPKTKADIKADWLGRPELSDEDIMAKYGVSRSTLRYHFGKRGLPIGRPKRGLTIEERQSKQEQKREQKHFAWTPEDIDHG